MSYFIKQIMKQILFAIGYVVLFSTNIYGMTLIDRGKEPISQEYPQEAKAITPTLGSRINSLWERLFGDKLYCEIRIASRYLITARLWAHFPNLAKKGYDPVELCNDLLFEYEDHQELPESQKLRWCTCTKLEARLFLILQQLNDIITHHNPLEPFTHLEFGESGYLQLYLLGYALLQLGFKNINLIVVGLNSDEFIKHGNLVEYSKKLQTALFRIARKKGAILTIRTLSAQHPDGYFTAIQSKPHEFRAHSYSMVDPGSERQIDDYYTVIRLGCPTEKPTENSTIYILAAGGKTGIKFCF